MEKLVGFWALDVTKGGAADGGNVVHFTVRMGEDDKYEDTTFLCKHQVFSSILPKLMSFGTIAAEERAKAGGDQHMDISRPFSVSGLRIGRSMTDDSVALRIQTKENIPVDLVMSKTDARNLIEGLQQEIGGTPFPDQGKPN